MEGYGGRFGDIGGGIVLEPYHDWIGEMTGIVIPEPAVAALLAGLTCLIGVFLLRHRRAGRKGGPRMFP